VPAKGDVLKRFLFLARNVLESNFKRLAFPYKLTFAVTYKCNLECKICMIWKKAQREELLVEEIDRFFRKSNNFSWIDLTGGEIFLRKDISEIVKIILRRCRNLKILHFPTNGQFTAQALDLVSIINNGGKVKPVVSVSIEGEEGISDEIRGEGTWGRALQSYDLLKRSKVGYVSLGITLSKHNAALLNIGKLVDSINRRSEYFKEDDLHYNLAHYSSHYYNNNSDSVLDDPLIIEGVKREISGRISERFSIRRFLERNYLYFMSDYAALRKVLLPCQAMSASCFLDPYGDIYPCSIFSKKLKNIGDISYDLSSYWKSPEAKEAFEGIKSGICPGCWSPCEAYQAILGNLRKTLFANSVGMGN
jgi:radical SAM protein with 4Fe4S-binding SPASM domain